MWRRLQARWWIIRNSAHSLNRRVAVENFLLDVFHGRRPAPTPQQCLRLAQHLGIPFDKTVTLKDRLDANS